MSTFEDWLDAQIVKSYGWVEGLAFRNALDKRKEMVCANCAYWGHEEGMLSQRCAHIEAKPVMIPAERSDLGVRGTTDAQIYTQPDFYCKSFQPKEESE